MEQTLEKQPTYEELAAENARLKQELAAENAALKAKIALLEDELAALKKLIFGTKSERFVPAENGEQLDLGLNGAPPATPPEPETETVVYERQKPQKKGGNPPSRQALPAHLPRTDIIIEPDEDTSGMKRIGEEVTEELEYKPPTLFVNRYIRPKYARPDENGVATGLLPSRPIEKGIAGAGLLAHITISKFVDHLPLYRQSKMFERQGIVIPRSTLGDWISATCTTLEPLFNLHREQVLSAHYLMADETPIRVLDFNNKGKAHLGYFWVYYDPLAKRALFDYRQGRGREGPVECLENFQGALQTDGYRVYEAFGKRDGVILYCCMAHARRKFAEARENDRPRAEYVLAEMQKLYAVERRARESDLSYEERQKLRREEALPVLDSLKTWLEENYPKILPKSAIGKAVAYALARWSKLCRYVEDGRIEIDNNLVENAIRPVALGRKNYLFAGSHTGAERAAMLYSLLSTAKANGVEPFAWLRDVLARIADHPRKNLAELLPQNWKPVASD